MSAAAEAVALGEALIDLVPEAGSPERFVAAPGGAPANVAAGLARLGRRTMLVARVGADRFRRRLIEALAEAGVDVGAVAVDRSRPAPLAVVQPGAPEAAGIFVSISVT